MLLRSLTGLAAALLLSGCAVPTQHSAPIGDETIELISSRKVALRGRIVTPESLPDELKKQLGDHDPKQIHILLKLGRDTPYADMAAVVTILSKAGYERIDLTQQQ